VPLSQRRNVLCEGIPLRTSKCPIWIAVAVGLLLSITLFGLSYATRSAILALPQFPGFYVCWRLFGFESATRSQYGLVGIPINAAVYSLILFAACAIWSWVRHRK
jgi:hypothetical protein